LSKKNLRSAKLRTKKTCEEKKLKENLHHVVEGVIGVVGGVSCSKTPHYSGTSIN
jgi:hypothetical protein